MYNAFPFMRMAGTAGEIMDPFEARAQYQAAQRRSVAEAGVVAEASPGVVATRLDEDGSETAAAAATMTQRMSTRLSTRTLSSERLL